nr:MAG TPA: hypothetical protein [Caudoviricetes sp.]
MVLPVAAMAFIASTAMQAGSSILSAYENRQAAKSEIKQQELQKQQIQLERANMADQYVDNRTQLIGSVNQMSGRAGVRVRGSVANSLNQSLTQMNIEEAQNDYNKRMELQTVNAQQKNAQRTKKYAYLNGFLNAGSTALSGYSTYDRYWGSNAKTNNKLGG